MKKKLFSLVLLFWVCSYINAFDWNGKIKISNWDDINDSHYKWVTTEVFDTFYAKNRDIYLNSFPQILTTSDFRILPYLTLDYYHVTL